MGALRGRLCKRNPLELPVAKLGEGQVAEGKNHRR